MSYYETNSDKWNKDCHTLNSAIGNVIDEIEDSIKPRVDGGNRHKKEFVAEVVPSVLVSLLARHFKHFHFDHPEDILNYMNFIKKALTHECEQREEMDMVKSIEYGSEVTA